MADYNIYYINTTTTMEDLRSAVYNGEILTPDYNCCIHDPRVAAWCLENVDEFNIYDLGYELLNDARIVLAVCQYDIAHTDQLDHKWLAMDFNELFKAALFEHLEDPEEDWRIDIKNKLFIDRDYGHIWGFDEINEEWRDYTDLELQEELGIDAGRYF